MVYGPRDQEVLKVFRLARLGLAPVLGDGSAGAFAPCTAPTWPDALVAAGTTAAAAGRIYYACHPEIFTGAELARRRGPRHGQRPAVIRVPARHRPRRARGDGSGARGSPARRPSSPTDKANEFFQPAWTGDPEPLARDTGWRAARNLETGLAETYAWYRTAGWL